MGTIPNVDKMRAGLSNWYCGLTVCYQEEKSKEWNTET